ncbi:MAG: hypothetical protein ACI4WT_10035 [Oligosphaeraceae bacterium]
MMTGTFPSVGTCLSASLHRLPIHPETGSALDATAFRQAAAWSAYARNALFRLEALAARHRLRKTQPTLTLHQATEFLDQALRLDPDASDYLRKSWSLWHRRHDKTPLSVAYEPIYRANPYHVDNVCHFALILMNEKQQERAFELVRQAFIHSGHTEGQLAMMLFALAQGGNHDETDALLQKLEALPHTAIHDWDAARATRASLCIYRAERLEELKQPTPEQTQQAKQLRQQARTIVEQLDGPHGAVPTCILFGNVLRATGLWQKLHDYLASLDQHPVGETAWWLDYMLAASRHLKTYDALLDALPRFDFEHDAPTLNPHTLRELVVLCLEANDPDYHALAVTIQTALLRLQPDSIPEALNLVRVLIAAKRHKQARQFLTAIPADKLNERDRIFRNAVLADLGEPDKAYRDYSRMLAEATFNPAQHPLSPQFFYRFSMLCWTLGKRDQALELAKRCHQLNPDSPQLCNYYGYLLAELNQQLPLAKQLILKALDKEPDNPAYLDSLAWVLFRQGHPQQALEAMTKLLKACNHNYQQFDADDEVAQHLQQIFLQLGMPDTAKLYAPTPKP